jgi:pimeloyl-ACP methyl ester carboxylesterase
MQSQGHSWRGRPCFCVALLVALLSAVPVRGQAAQAKAAQAKPSAAETEPPPAQHTFLTTKDGWKIHCAYYAPQSGVRKGKEVVPIIAVHGWGGQGGEYHALATLAQRYGHAVAVPDLRGHGRSTTWKSPDGDLQRVTKEQLGPADREGMVLDLEAVKHFLIERNNAGDVNVESLCLIAASEGTIVALNWTAADWSWPATTAGKQGQDVKALVLLTPDLSFHRLTAQAAVSHPAISRWLSVMVAVGQRDKKAAGEAKRLYTRLERMRPPVPDDPRERLRKQDLFWIPADTEVQGTQLLDGQLPVYRAILRFVHLRLVQIRDNMPWAARRSPLDG